MSRCSLFLWGLLIFLIFSTLGWTDENTWLKPPPVGSNAPGAQDASVSEREQEPPKEVIFSFLQEFQEASAKKLKKGKLIKGWLQEDGFQFEDSRNMLAKNIFLSEKMNVNGRRRKAIWFLTGPGFESLLTYHHVPPGRRLRISYALPDETFAQKAPAFVQVEVRIGKKKLFEVQINTKGWKAKTADLTLPFLLNQSFDLTVAIRSLDPDPKLLGLYGYIE